MYWLERPTQRANRSHLEALRASGIRVPTLDDAPELLPEARPYMHAYELLATRRTSTSEGPNPISMADIWAYVQLNVLTNQDDIDDLVRTVIMLDNMTVADARKRIAKGRRRNK